MKALVLVLVLSGCYFKTRDTLVEMPISAPKVTSSIVTDPAPHFTTGTRGNILSFRVQTRRQCVSETSQQFEITEGKKVALAWQPALLLAAVLPYAFVAIAPVTGVVALLRVKDHKPETVTETRVVSRSNYACSVPLSGQVANVRFPSGITFVATTDPDGFASVTIPNDEIAKGAARIEIEGGGRTVDYDRTEYDRQLLAIEVDE